MELGGHWRAAEATEALRRGFADPDFDDRLWSELPVPGHWRSHPDFATTDGPILYRRRLESPDQDVDGRGDRRAWLHLDGLFYQGDVWLDRAYLGDTEGYFFPHIFEVTTALGARNEHVLAIEVACSRPDDHTAKRNLTGAFQHWNSFDRDWNPGGIWRPVHIEHTGPVRIAQLRVLCLEATADRATLEVRAVLDAKRSGTVAVMTAVTRLGAGAAGPAASAGAQPAADPTALREAEQQLAAGTNDVRWRIAVEHPELWWPQALGDQPLYDVHVEVAVDGVPSHRRRLTTGLRQVRMRNFIATVNGERLFLKGSNQGPTRRALGEATAAELEGDVLLARQAGLDLLRIHAHISRPELYQAADRHGVLLWQDMPLHGGYAGVRKQAIRQAAEAVNLLGHHPSIAMWCGHDEPFRLDPDWSGLAGNGRPPARTAVRTAVGQALPTWNKTALDRSIRRALDKADGSRPVIPHSGVLPHPAWGTDSHLYFGWYHGDERELPGVLARIPVLARFVSEFGAQAVPARAEFCHPECWPDLDWPRLSRAHALQKVNFDRYVPPAAYPSFEAWRDATQAYQAQVIRHHIETLRRLKYRPTGGFCQFSLADGQPAVSWSVLDHERVPKAGYETLAAACAPVIVVADRPAASYQPGDDPRLTVHVVNDLRVPISDGRIDAVLSWAGGRRAWRFEGDIGPDSCIRIGLLSLSLPDAPGPLTVELDLEWRSGKAHSRYDSRLVPPADGQRRSSE